MLLNRKRDEKVCEGWDAELLLSLSPVMDGVVAQRQAGCKGASVTSIKAIHFPSLIWHSLFVTTLVTFS